MNGNVMEWTSSGYSENYNGLRRDSAKMIRGGSFNFVANTTRSAFRFSSSCDDRLKFVGFRLVFGKTLSNILPKYNNATSDYIIIDTYKSYNTPTKKDK